MDKKLKIVFAPGSFDEFDGTQEELDDLVKSLTDFFQSGEFEEALADAPEVSEVDEDLIKYFDTKNTSRTIH